MTKAKPAATAAAQLVLVKLAKPHTHAGVDYPAGAELEVDATTAQWLQAHGVIAAPTAAE